MGENNTFGNVMTPSIILGRSGRKGCVALQCKWVVGPAFKPWCNLLMLDLAEGIREGPAVEQQQTFEKAMSEFSCNFTTELLIPF